MKKVYSFRLSEEAKGALGAESERTGSSEGEILESLIRDLSGQKPAPQPRKKVVPERKTGVVVPPPEAASGSVCYHPASARVGKGADWRCTACGFRTADL